MLGGGVFTTQNKMLPGSYINFVSAARASANLSERGTAAIAMELDWGKADEVIKITSESFQKDTLKLIGISYGDEKLKGLRDMFRNIRTLYLYRLNGEGEQAENTYAKAVCAGTLGNSIKIAIQKNADDETKLDVITYLNSEKMDVQTVKTASELAANEWVTFKAEAELAETASTPLTGGINGTATIAEHQTFLDAIESYSFNALCCNSSESTIKNLYIAFTKRMRDEVGAKFQTVVYKSNDADYEGVVSVENKVTEGTEHAMIYFTTGIIAGCAINASNTNKKYDGEFTVDTKYTQSQLEEAIKTGKFIYHLVGEDVRVLTDINTFISFTEGKNEDFASNQVVRVLDQIANDIALIFNTQFLGIMPNDAAGRVSLWNTIVKHHEQLQTMRAIENFTSESVAVEQGETKKSVVVNDTISVVGTMEKMYLTVVVA